MEMCRACLLTEHQNNMLLLDDSFATNYNLLTNLNVMIGDGLPQYSCRNCVDVVTYFIEFRMKAISSETTLKDMVEEVKPECESLLDGGLKNEMKPEIILEPDIALDSYIDHNFDDLEIDVKEDIYLNVKKIRSSRKKSYVCTKKTQLKSKKASQTVLKEPKKEKEKKKSIKIETSLPCGLCKKKLYGESDLKNHLETHRKYNHCGNCSLSFNTWQQLFAHRVQHLQSKERSCHICGKYIVTSASLEYHYLSKHSGEKPGQEILLQCQTCLKFYKSPRKLQKHIKYVHNMDKPTFICDYCSKRCNTKSLLRVHLISHQDVKSFKCHFCAFSCKFRTGLKDHLIRKHAPDKVTCSNCNRIFKDQQDFDKHKEKCFMKYFVCPICGIELPKSARVSRHMRSHEPEGRFKCDRCSKTYRTSEALKVHVNRHDGVRAYKCHYCPASFFGASSRTKHHRIHTGEKPYICTICARGFMSNSNLKTHMKVHGLFLINHKNKNPDNVTQDN